MTPEPMTVWLLATDSHDEERLGVYATLDLIKAAYPDWTWEQSPDLGHGEDYIAVARRRVPGEDGLWAQRFTVITGRGV